MLFFKRIKFWQKLMLMGVIPLALLGLVIGTLSFIKADTVVKQSGKRILSDTVNRIDISINMRTRLINSAVQSIVSGAPMQELLASGEAGGPDTGALAQSCASALSPFAEITDVNVLLGDVLVYTAVPGKTLHKERARAFCEAAALHPGKVNWSDLTSGLCEDAGDAQPQKLLIYTALTGTDGPAGLLALEMDPRTAGSAILTKQKMLDHQTTFITDRQGRVIYSDNAVRPEQLGSVLACYQSGRRSFSMEAEGETYACASQYNGLTSWVTFTMIEEDRMFPEAGSLKRYIYVLVSVSVLLASAFFLILSLAITKPLAELNNGMKQAQNKNFALQLQNDRADEIGELTDSFNFMVDRIRILVHQVYQEKLAQKSAEIEALQAQINPHFLYNTLDSINWMLIDRDEMDISSIVVALGKLMQYSMDTKASLVPLSEEYRNIRDYLLIQKYRLEDRLEFDLALEAGLESFLVPKLILQPLVENAIDHGIVTSGGKGRVDIRTYGRDERICITVRDNGAGMSASQLAQYRRLLQNDPGEQVSIGIKNVARRLQLHFNDHCTFEVESREGEGTAITLSIPAITGEERRET